MPSITSLLPVKFYFIAMLKFKLYLTKLENKRRIAGEWRINESSILEFQRVVLLKSINVSVLLKFEYTLKKSAKYVFSQIRI